MVVISGGGLLRNLGEKKQCKEWFLNCLKSSDISSYVLIDRLYRRYVRLEDIEATKIILFKKTRDSKFTRNIYESFLDCVDAVYGFLEDWNKYMPIHLTLSDIPYSFLSNDIPLEDYDNLEGDPLWMRPEYMLEKYRK